MASSSININNPSPSSYSLPAPEWRKGLTTNQTILTGENVDCDMFYPKIHRVNQQLIDDGELYVQFGVIKDYDYSYSPIGPKYRRQGLKWYAPYPNTIGLTSGDIGGNTVNDGLITQRTNLIPVTAQNQTLTQAIPYWQHYKTRTIELLTADPTTNGTASVSAPYLTGTKNMKGMWSPNLYLPGGSRYKTRPKRSMTMHRLFSTSTWFCRLVVIRNGRVIQYGDISNPVIIRPNMPPFSENTMSSSLFERGLAFIPNNSYGVREFKGEIITKYKK